MPPDILAEACTIWRRTEKWFPRPGELLALTGPMIRKRRTALADVSRVIDRLDGRAAKGNNFRPMSDDERGSAADLFKKLRSMVQSAPEPPEAA